MPHIVSKVIDWLGGHELGVLLALFVVVAGTWVFFVVADNVVEGKTQKFDERILRALHQVDDPETPEVESKNPVGPGWCVELGRDVTALGGYAILTLVTVGVVGFLRLDRRFHTMWFLLAAIIGGFVFMMALKSGFERDRPPAELQFSYAATSSFPSGHSMMSAVVYLTLGAILTTLVAKKRLKFYFLSVAVLLTALVGSSRVYMGVHWPTDVLAGWSAGLAWATSCWLVARALQRRGQIEKEA